MRAVTYDLQACQAGCSDQACLDECEGYYLTCAHACVNCNDWCGGEYGDCYYFGCAWPLTCNPSSGCCDLE